MSDEPYYDLQDYPATPLSEEFLVLVERAITQRKDGTRTIAEVAAIILEHVRTMDPSALAALQREHDAMTAYHARQGHDADYARLKAELQRVSPTTRLLLDQMRDAKPS